LLVTISLGGAASIATISLASLPSLTTEVSLALSGLVQAVNNKIVTKAAQVRIGFALLSKAG
jgi:hypothetical protein